MTTLESLYAKINNDCGRDELIQSVNKLEVELADLKDKLHRRNMQIKNLKQKINPECQQCGSKRITLLCRECDYEIETI